MTSPHWQPATSEEEDYALALALSASLQQQGTSQQGHQQHHANGRAPAASTSAPSKQQAQAPAARQPAPRPSAPPMPPRMQPQQPHSQPAPARPAAAPQPQRPQQQQQPMVLHGGDGCPGCGKSVSWMLPHVTALGRRFHTSCLRCGLCGDVLSGPFATGSDGLPYHVPCHKTKFHPMCSICEDFIPVRPDGRIEFKELRFWKEVFCPQHENHATQCCSCSRYKPLRAEWVSLSDNRRELCLECVSSIVIDTRDAQPLYDQLLTFFKDLGLPHPQRAPMMLVDSRTLNEYSSKEGRDISGGPIFHVRGLCLATVYRSIPTIMRLNGGLGYQVSAVSTSSLDSRSTTTCSVTAILVMYGLPRLLTGSILAHELMHAWLRMRNVAALQPQVEEGLCQLMACLWLDLEHDRLKDNAMEQRLASYFAFQIREDTSDVYGEGFRIAYDTFQRNGGGMRGMMAVVNNVLRTGRLTG